MLYVHHIDDSQEPLLASAVRPHDRLPGSQTEQTSSHQRQDRNAFRFDVGSLRIDKLQRALDASALPSEAEARAILEGIKLTLGAVEEVNDTKAAKGRITESVPAAGDEVAPGTEVKVKVSSGKVTVPDLVGKTQNEAFTLLTEAGLAPKSTYKQTADAAEGTVLEQDKKAGEVIDAGTSVSITVAQATPPTPTPASPSPSPSASVSPSPSVTPTP